MTLFRSLVLLVGFTNAFDFGFGSGVVGGTGSKHAAEELTDATLIKYLEENNVAAVLFYAPWCFYSQQMMPDWDMAMQKLGLHDPPVKLAKIDAHRYTSSAEKYGVRGFPAIKLFLDGAVFDFDASQGRGWQLIVKWVNGHLDRDHVLKDVEDADHFLHDNDLNVVGLFPDGYNSTPFAKATRHFDAVMFAEAKGTEISTKVAEHVSKHAALVCETLTVGQSPDPIKTLDLPREKMFCESEPKNAQRPDWTDKFKPIVTGKKLEVSRADSKDGWQQNLQLKCCNEEHPELVKQNIPIPGVVMFMPHDERFAVYDGDIEDMQQVEKWIHGHRTPMVMEFSTETVEQIFPHGGAAKATGQSPVIFLFSSPGASDKELKIVHEAASQLRGKAVFVTASLNSQVERRLGELAGVDDEQLPVLTLIESPQGGGPTKPKRYRLSTEGLDAAKVVNFVTEYESGTLKPWLRTEPVPTAEDIDGPVGVLVGSTFTASAHDDTVDTLLNFYAPWCGHCRKFEPLYKDLARNLGHVKTLKIMKLDATRNEVEGMEIQAFPMVYLFPAKGKPEVQYQGNRQPEDLTRWLKEHCTIPFDETPPKKSVKVEEGESGLLDGSEEDL